MIKYALCLALVGGILAGCASSGAQVSDTGTRDKEKQMEDATKKLNGGQASQDQQGQ